MINYSIIINSMSTINTATVSNYVVQINYTYKGIEDEYSSEINNSLFYEVQEGTFVPYADLKQEIVDSWIISSLGESGVENYEMCIADQIAMQKNPPVTPEITPLPWS